MDDLRSAASYHRDRLFAETLVMLVGMAAETHPELVREALGKVFDLTAWEDQSRRIGSLVAQMHDQMAYVRNTVDDLARQIVQLEERLDYVAHPPRPSLKVHQAQ